MKKDFKILILFAVSCLVIGLLNINIAYAVAAGLSCINMFYMWIVLNLSRATPRSIAKFKSSDPISSCALSLVVWSIVFGILFGFWADPLILTPIAFVAASGITTSLILRK